MVSKAALLCPGPSLPRDWHEDLFDEYGLVVAVNSAGHVYRCHYLFGSDPQIVVPVIDGKKKKPLNALVTNRGYVLKATRAKVPAQQCNRIKHPMEKNEECAFNMPNALKFCLEQAAYVEIFGMDWNGMKNDFAGMKGDHRDRRWRNEAIWLRRVWDDTRIIVNGDISRAKLDYFAGRTKEWPQ